MAEDYFDAKLALNPVTGNVVAGASAQVYAITDTTFTTPLAITDLSGIPLAQLIASPTGIYPPFKVPTGQQNVLAKSGSMITPITSKEGSRGEPGQDGTPGDPGAGVDPTGSAPGQVYTSVGPDLPPEWKTPPPSTGITGAPATWPGQFPPTSHTHGAGQISDASTVGRQVLTAPDAQQARAAIGAGTGNGTSNLKVGTSASDAAPGNHSHAAETLQFVPAGGISATTVQDAIVQAAGMGSGGGTAASQVQVLRFASGQYPAFPATKPAGVNMFVLVGPVTPTTGNVAGGIPSYVGNGSTQIPAEYRVNASLT